MGLKQAIIDWASGDNLSRLWRVYRRQRDAKHPLVHKYYTLALRRCARRHGGYIGPGAVIKSMPSLPHGLHGVYISRFASIGAGCRIYQNVTIGEVGQLAPTIGDHCLIGAGAVLVGNIRIGSGVKIGAGAVVSIDVPDGCTVVSQTPRIIKR